MSTIQRMHWILATKKGFDLFADHHNLIFLFDPLSVVPDLSQTTVHKFLRWAVLLSAYSYTCVHKKDGDNVWAEILIRWMLPIVVRCLVCVLVLPLFFSSKFEWSSVDKISTNQTEVSNVRPSHLELCDGLWEDPVGAVWIPDKCDDLQLRLCIIAHRGPSGSRSSTSTKSTLQNFFFWSTMTANIRIFVHSCTHCLSTIGGLKVPRPFGPSVYGTNPNDILQFDYIEIAPNSTGEMYVLMFQDDHSDYKWGFAFPDTSAQNDATAIDRSAAFGVSDGFMSDHQPISRMKPFASWIRD